MLTLILAGGVTTRAGTDVFMRAVGFALTGRDDADPKVNGDGAKCVFAINNDIFRLSNVYTDRIAIQGYTRITWDDVVFEETTECDRCSAGRRDQQDTLR